MSKKQSAQLELEDAIAAAVSKIPVAQPGIFFRSPYDGLQDEFTELSAIHFPPPTEEEFSALQSSKDECDINLIVRRMENAQFDEFAERVAQGQYVDLASYPDFRQAQDMVIQAQDAFDALPAKIRREFDNDPAGFLELLDKGDPEDLARLGLAPPPAPAPAAPPSSPDANALPVQPVPAPRGPDAV